MPLREESVLGLAEDEGDNELDDQEKDTVLKKEDFPPLGSDMKLGKHVKARTGAAGPSDVPRRRRTKATRAKVTADNR